MTKYREIIRLHSLNFSERNIALSCSVSRNTVSKVPTVHPTRRYSTMSVCSSKRVKRFSFWAITAAERLLY